MQCEFALVNNDLSRPILHLFRVQNNFSVKISDTIRQKIAASKGEFSFTTKRQLSSLVTEADTLQYNVFTDLYKCVLS